MSSSKLSEQQQRRITDNFRAAKAKLAQKRPHSLSSSSPLSPLPLVHCTSENEPPVEVFHGERCPQLPPNFRYVTFNYFLLFSSWHCEQHLAQPTLQHIEF